MAFLKMIGLVTQSTTRTDQYFGWLRPTSSLQSAQHTVVARTCCSMCITVFMPDIIIYHTANCPAVYINDFMQYFTILCLCRDPVSEMCFIEVKATRSSQHVQFPRSPKEMKFAVSKGAQIHNIQSSQPRRCQQCLC